MKNGKLNMVEGINLPNQEKSERSEKRKPINTLEYWKLAPSDKWRLKKKIKRVSQENQKAARDKTI